jgi:uncharacterized protein YecT (DUF1311 family)
MIRVLAVASLLLLAAPAVEVRAAPAHHNSDECLKDPLHTTSAQLLACAKRLYPIEDARINREYRAEMRALKTPQEKAKLRAKARQWISDRDRICQRPGYDGKVSEVEMTVCMLDLTAEM